MIAMLNTLRMPPGALRQACLVMMIVGLLGLVARGAAAQAVQAPMVGKLKVLHELEDAEILMFQGKYDEAYRRCEHARKAILQEVPFDRALIEAAVDMLQAEIRLVQGYFSTARKKLEGAGKSLTSRAVFFANNGASREQLRAFNFRIGYAKLLLGDLAVADVRVQSIIDGDRDNDAALKRCRPLYEEGIKVIRGTWNSLPDDQRQIIDNPVAFHALRKTNPELFNGLRVAGRLMHKADLREVLLLVLQGDLSRAEGIFDEVERFVQTKDLGWILQFHPDGEAGAAITAAGANAGEEEVAALTPAQLGLKATAETREAIRVALFYIELLKVKARLQLATKNLPIAEESASLARDIAEERFPKGIPHRTAMLDLADVYLACHANEVEEARRNRADVFEYQGRVVNVHQKAAESYLDDADELVATVEQEMQQENASQPVHFLAADLRRRIAEVRKDPQAIQVAKRNLGSWAEARKLDKPPPTK
jgi:hypothetical protein